MSSLNPRQLEAVDAEPGVPVKVEAGAGTGKTRVLVARYTKLVLTDGVSPEKILALTFTRRAASEMRRRIFEKVHEKSDPVLYRALQRSSITNFHSFCYAMMKEDPGYFAVGPDARIAGDVEMRRLRAILRRRFDEGAIGGVPEIPLREEKGPEAIGEFFERCLNIVNRCRSLLMRPEDLEKNVRDTDDEEYKALVDTVCALWREYERMLRRSDLLDFTALIELCVHALARNTELRSRYRDRFDFILVDEFQDTSGAQNELVRLLSRDLENVMVVGDDQQSIYRWRDARVENIREFRGKEIPLEINYRSVPPILDLASRFISMDPYYKERGRRLDPERKGGGTRITLFHPEAELGFSPEDEARGVVGWIRDLTGCEAGAPLSYGDFAVLMRSLKSETLEALERELSRAGIPYAVLGPGNSLESELLAALLDLLTLLVYPERVETLLGLLEREPLALDDASLCELFRTAWEVAGKSRREDTLGMEEVLADRVLDRLSDRSAAQRCRALSETLDLLKADLLSLDLPAFLWSAVEKFSLLVGLHKMGGSRAAVDNLVRQLAAIVEAMEEAGDHGIGSLIDYLESATRVDDVTTAAEPRLPEDRVKIMTIHQAKGLEFPAVALAGLESKRDKTPTFFVSKEHGLYASGYEGRDPKELDEAEREKAQREQEERCLVYVAITRARDHLLVSSPVPSDGEGKKVSPFFIDVMRSLEEGGIDHRVVRRAEELAEAGPREKGEEDVDEESIERAIARWERGRERMEALERGSLLSGRRTLGVTWRSLRSFIECPLAFACSRVLAGGDTGEEVHVVDDSPEPAGSAVPGGISHVAYGELVHRILEEIYRSKEDAGQGGSGGYGDDGQSDVDVRTIAETVIEEIDHLEAHRREIIEAAERAVGAFLSTPLGRAKGVEKAEWEFYLPVGDSSSTGDVLFTGRIDRLDVAEDRVTVIDFKTGERKEEHEFQVGFYCWALHSIYPERRIDGHVCYIGEKPEIVDVDVGGIVSSIETASRELLHAHQTGRFEPRPGEVCEGCGYRGFCGGGVE